MTRERPLAARRAAIDARIDAALESATANSLALARTTMEEAGWFGPLLACSYDSVADGSAADGADAEGALLAAAAIELLAGYCRLRGELLVQLDDGVAHSLNRDPPSALLAADFLYTSAYSTLASIDHARIGACFDAFTDASLSIVGAFDAGGAGAEPSRTDRRPSIEGTAGALGETAATVGAALAGVERDRRDRFATLGRGFSTARRVRLALDSDVWPAHVGRPDLDDRRFVRSADRSRAEAERALSRLPSPADAGPLEALVDDALPPV
ncbi:hypothetical protein [Halorarum halobium]|uniref:hypothetical protein n=1 Tax=Halorarum halobium TaxID=3075121 RepID=UPI0028AD9AEF|nr:hypothetical protein [Halobaculum sp. XH14]